jgi:hypothetical protein
MATELTMALARALGLPKYTQRAVLTLDASEPPRLELTVLPVDEQGRLIVEAGPVEGAADRLAQVQFMLRLEPFADNTSSRGDADGPA